MKFNPITQQLFTDDGTFIKRLECRYKIDWDKLENASDSRSRACDQCGDQIIDTAQFSDSEMIEIINSNKDACFKVDLNQTNLIISTIHADPGS